MGHREDLLAGAKRCLYEQGYARTTARDIVAASGTNLASIGYHFGSKEALLTAALIAALDEWDEKMRGSYFPPGGIASYDHLATAWQEHIALVRTHRTLMFAHLEALTQARHLPEVQRQLAATYQRTRETYAAATRRMFEGMLDEASARAVVSYQMALSDGLTIQQLLDPENALSAEDIVRATRVLVRFYQAAQDPEEADHPG